MRCPKLSDCRLRGGRKRDREKVPRLAAASRTQQQPASVPDGMLRLCMNFQVALSRITWSRTTRCHRLLLSRLLLATSAEAANTSPSWTLQGSHNCARFLFSFAPGSACSPMSSSQDIFLLETCTKGSHQSTSGQQMSLCSSWSPAAGGLDCGPQG